MKIKNILSAAAVAVAGITSGQGAEAGPVTNIKPEIATNSEALLRDLDIFSKSFSEEYKQELAKTGANGIQILNAPEEVRKVAKSGSINSITDPAKYSAFKVTFTINGIRILNHETILVTESLKTKNKYALQSTLRETIISMFKKNLQQTTVSNNGIAINASGDARVNITGGYNSPRIIGSVIKGGITMDNNSNSSLIIINSSVEGPLPKGSVTIKDNRIILDGKDVTPDGVTGKLSFEERKGETFVNGKPLKK